MTEQIALNRFSAFQRLAWQTLVLSVTRRCPLSCAHCITSSSRSPEFGILDVTTARRWARELPALAEDGLRFVTFTGGEPTLALDAVAVLADRARAAGISTAVVSSGAFARTDAAADRVVRALDAVARWDLGYDEFHAEYLPLERFARAVAAIRRRGHELCIRVCEGPDPIRTAVLVAELREFAGAETEIHLQEVRRLGRAENLTVRPRASAAQPEVPLLPCTSTGPLVRDDGTASPCCAGLAYAGPNDHPFDLGVANSEGSLGEVWRAWRADQLLRLIRLVGFGPILRWLGDAGIDLGPLPTDHTCELCPALWRTPGAADVVRAMASDSTVRNRLDAIESHLFGDVFGQTA